MLILFYLHNNTQCFKQMVIVLLFTGKVKSQKYVSNTNYSLYFCALQLPGFISLLTTVPASLADSLSHSREIVCFYCFLSSPTFVVNPPRYHRSHFILFLAPFQINSSNCLAGVYCQTLQQSVGVFYECEWPSVVYL